MNCFLPHHCSLHPCGRDFLRGRSLSLARPAVILLGVSGGHCHQIQLLVEGRMSMMKRMMLMNERKTRMTMKMSLREMSSWMLR